MEHLVMTEKRFNEIIEILKEGLQTIRTNRPNPKLIEDVKVNYLNQFIPIKQLGSTNIEIPRDLVVNVWDQSAVAPIVSAIESANLGVGVSSQGKTVRVTLPALTEERKQELVKLVKSISEENRIKMRLERDEAVKKTKDLKDEDERFRAKEKLQKLVDGFNKMADELTAKKTEDILG
ncbi:ribosome-recycling factor [Patescibacteria group bacterium]|nr:ribosome-recycling factor [Patescibacteria group bacterium]